MRPRCPHHRALLAWIDGQGSVERRLSLEQHLEVCEKCRARSIGYQQIDEALLNLSGPELQPADRARLLKGIARRIARRQAEEPIETPSHRERLRAGRFEAGLSGAARAGWRWAAAAAMLLSVGAATVWLTNFGDDPSNGAPRNSLDTAVAERENDSADPAELETEPAPPGDEVYALELGEARREFQQRLARVDSWLRSLPSRGPLERPLQMPEGLLARSLVPCLEHLIEDDDSLVAVPAARVFVELAESRPESLRSLSVVTALQRALRRPDCGDRAFAALRRIDQPSLRPTVQRALQSAVDIPGLRGPAVLELAMRWERDGRGDLERELLRLLRSETEEDRQILATVLRRMPTEAPRILEPLATLYAEGAPRSPLEGVAARLGEEAREELSRSLAGHGALGVLEALQVASLTKRAEFIPAIEPHARQGRHPAAAMDALAGIGGAEGLGALLTVACDPSASRSRRDLAGDTFVRTLGRSEHAVEWANQIAIAASDREWIPFLEYCNELGTAATSNVDLSLAHQRSLPAIRRATAAVMAAVRDHDSDREALLRLLEDEFLLRPMSSPAPDGEEETRLLAASLLVSLQVLDGDRGLARGLRVLGVELDPRRLRSLTMMVSGAADHVLTSRFSRELARIEALVF